MNCANHPDRPRSAFCQNCGKPLCSECIRTIGNSIFCEPCYALHTSGAATTPGALYTSPTVPRPGLAAFLGLIPGVGAMYNGQYAKGLVHLIIFALLVSIANHNNVFVVFVFGWICYMAIEAYHTARARRDGTPVPNPFGFNELGDRLGFGRSWSTGAAAGGPFPGPFAGPIPGTSGATGFAANVPPGADVPPPSGTYTAPWGQPFVPPATNWGAPQEGWGYGVPPVPPGAPVPPMPDPSQPVQRQIPTGAIWLIGLGLLFLFGNTGVFWLRARFVGPLLLIALGVWSFVRRMTSTGLGLESDGTPAYTWRLARAARGSVWLVVTGFVWLLDVFGILYWHQSWPIFMIVAGILLFLRHTLAPAGYPPPGYPYPAYPGTTAPPVAPQQPPAGSSTAIVPLTDPTRAEEGR